MNTIATKLQVGIAGCAVAAAASLTPVVAQAAPIPVPAAPVQVLDNIKDGPLFSGLGGGVDLLALLNNNGSPTALPTIWNPFQFFINAFKQFVALICYKFTGGHAA